MIPDCILCVDVEPFSPFFLVPSDTSLGASALHCESSTTQFGSCSVVYCRANAVASLAHDDNTRLRIVGMSSVQVELQLHAESSHALIRRVVRAGTSH